MKRLVWIAVGAATAVVVIRKGVALSERYLPAGTRDLVGTMGRVVAAARTARTEFMAGIADREEELRRDLIGDVDIEALRSGHKQSRAAHARDPRSRRASRGWADRPTEDPEDDGDDGLPYSFF